jgi:hypothetical protein
LSGEAMGKAPVRTGASPYHLEHRSNHGAILLVVVVVLVLDLLPLASFNLGSDHCDDD